ncbi:hypothetical protein ACF0H5_020185 [Mactra antiquata]
MKMAHHNKSRYKVTTEHVLLKRALMTVPVAFLLAFIASTTRYCLNEFVFQTNSYVIVDSCSDCYQHFQKLSTSRTIPKHIHQIFFFETSDILPKKLVDGQQSWLRQHPDYTYTLWNKTSINKLIREEFPFLHHLFHSYGHWVRKADVARYVVMYQYGGWYVDMDIVCKKSVHELEDEASHLNKTVVVRETEPVGFSNDFIGVTPKHPFFYTVLTALDKSNRWFIFPYANTMFTTGPLFLWGRYLNFDQQSSFHMISNKTYSKYLHLLHNSSWHSWDGIVIWFFFKDRVSFLFFLFALTLVLSTVYVVIKYNKKRIHKSCSLLNRLRERICSSDFVQRHRGEWKRTEL